ncbi:Hypothetical protein A7982_07036 [Minicystis rosea]|nr:Hypothetical protein A7982_07036 [Minicystis rosea]
MLEQLLTRHRDAGHVHLNDLSEVIGAAAITPDEVDELIARLESEGLRVGEELDGRDVLVMREILASARRLATALARRPTVAEIATDSGHPVHAVRRALEHAAAAAKPRRLPD